MGAAIIGVIGTLLGVVIGGGVNFFINRSQFIREKKYQEQQVIRQKLEEICKLAEEIDDSYRKTWLDSIQLMEYGKKMDFVTGIPLARLLMLINFYAVELKDTSKILEETRHIFGERLVEVINNAQADRLTRQRINSDITKAYIQISKVCETMATGSANIARRSIC
jgi:hypothetical protein